MKLVKKIIFRNKETYNRLYQGAELLFEVQKEVDWKGLTFEALEPSTIQYIPSSVSTVQSSFDAVNWSNADNDTISLCTGKKIYFKGYIVGNQSDTDCAKFKITGRVAASGSIMSLHNENPQDKSLTYDYEFCRLFYGCKSLVTAPYIPATTLTNYCYDRMFFNCLRLINAPELPATTLSYGCYNGMFNGCSSLTTAPALPATTLANYCYSYMFNGCSSLVTAPELPATTLVTDCYSNMFNGCSSLNYIKALFTTTPSNTYTSSWVFKVASSGTFVKNSEATWDVTGSYGIPTGWTIQIEEKPKVEYNALYVSGRYNFKIPKGDGTYYVIDTKNDCEVDIMSDNNISSRTGKIFTSNSQGDVYEWDLFLTGTKLYFDLSFKNNRRLSWAFGTLNANTKYTIGGSNGNYLGTDRALYVNGSKKASSTTKSTYNNTSDVAFIGENVTDFYVGNIKIYESTGLVYHIVPIMYNGNVAFYDKVNKRFMEITTTPPSEYVKTRATGEKVII